MRPHLKSLFTGFSAFLACLIVSAAQAGADDLPSRSSTPFQPGSAAALSAESRIIYNVPPDFTEFRYIAPIDIKASTDTVVGRFIVNKWDAATVEQVIGKPEEYYSKGVSFQSTDHYNAGKIFYLIYRDNYQGEIIDGISFKSCREDVIRKFGAPQFEDEKLQLIGYKGKQFYVFFIGGSNLEAVSVYRRDTDYDKELIKNVVNNEGIGGLWPVAEVARSAGVIWLDYISIGVKFASAGVPSNVTIYGNFEGDLTNNFSLPDDYAQLNNLGQLSKEKNLYEDDAIIVFNFRPETDLVFSNECSRLNTLLSVKTKTDTAAILSPEGNKMLVYDGCTGGNSNISVFFLDGSRPEIKQYTGFLGYFAWLNDRYIVYCGDGFRPYGPIYIFDIVNRSSIPLDMVNLRSIPLSRDEGSSYLESYYKKELANKIISSDNGKLVYEISGQGKYEQPYAFDSSGRIIMGERRQIDQ